MSSSKSKKDLMFLLNRSKSLQMTPSISPELILLTIAPFVLAFFQNQIQSSEVPLSSALDDVRNGNSVTERYNSR